MISLPERFSHARVRIVAFGAILACALGLAAGCARGPQGLEGVPQGTIVFPPPPAKARVQFLGSIFSPRDLPSQRSRWADFVLGEPPVEFRFVKPYAAALVGSRLYVCDSILSTVLVYDLLAGGGHPLAGDRGSGKIQEPNGLIAGPDGRIYVADVKRRAVLIYGPDEQFLTAWGRPEEAYPVALALSGDVLYVLDTKDDELEVWDARDGHYLRSIGKQGTGPGEFYVPTQLRVDPQGNLYVTDTLNFRVQKLAPDGTFLQQFGAYGDELGHFARPKGMDLDAHGRLFVADAMFCNVQIFDPQGRLLLFFGGPGPDSGNLALPAGLTVVPWPEGIPWLRRRLAPGFDPESLVLVVSQQGIVAVNLFAVARDERD